MFKETANATEFLENVKVLAKRFAFINISQAVFISHFNTQNV